MGMFRSQILFFGLLNAVASQAGPARHYLYTGNDPAHWTSSALTRQQAVAPADFTVFPCNAANCSVSKVIADANRNTYVVGSRHFPVQLPGGPGQASDVFVAKLDPAGATLFLATFSGKGSEEGRAIALDAAGNILVGGSTSSPNFPLRNAIQSERGVSSTGFLMKLNPDGSQLIYSTYFGGTSSFSWVRAIASDAAGNVYVTGQTGSREFPATPGMPAGTITGMGPGGVFGAFVAKLSSSGDRILYSGRISGNSVQCGAGSSCFLSQRNISGDAIALDSAGNAYIAGNANVTDLPTTPGALVPRGIGAWVARVKASGAGLDYLTYLGSANYVLSPFANPGNLAGGLAVDGSGNAYVIGKTNDPAFPATPGAPQPEFNGPADPPPVGPGPATDAFIAKLNPLGTAMVYATFLGGPGADAATAVAVDSAGAAYVTGTSDSSDFLSVLNPTGTALTFSSRYPGGSVSQAIAVDADGRARAASPGGLVSALTLSAAPSTRVFGVMSGAGGRLGAAVAPGEVVSFFGLQLGPPNSMVAKPGADGRMPNTLGGTQVLFDGVAAPLLYVSQDQINAVTPFALVPGKETILRLTAAGGMVEFRVEVVTSRPAIFGDGTAAAAMNQDGTINSASNPAKLGSVVAIWVTGTGAVFPAPTDGEVTTDAREYYCCQISVLDSRRADVLYAGAAPGIVAGVNQVNFRVPADLPIGISLPVPISLTVSGPNLNLPAPSTSSIHVAP